MCVTEKLTVKELLEDKIKGLYSAENQLLHAIPKMAKGSHNPALQVAFREHLKETENQVARLEQIAELLDIQVSGKKCGGMEALIQEGAEALEEKGDDIILDLGIIGAGGHVEHYEMAGYLTVIGLAQTIEAGEVVTLLNQSLAEEKAADQKLRKIAATLMKTAPTEGLKVNTAG
jgi:ferritin-like metal-binding protein YciE